MNVYLHNKHTIYYFQELSKEVKFKYEFYLVEG